MIRIEIISDISCPWCVIGYRSLQAAIRELSLEGAYQLTWRPFELNPNMPPEGQDRAEHIQQKYGLTPTQSRANRQHLIDRGEAVGYRFHFSEHGRIYNTFDAHRLIHWAAEHKLQTQLKLALFDLYFQADGNPSDHTALLRCASEVGLPLDDAKSVLASQQYASDVRADQAKTQQQGISAVPAFIFADQYLISGGQPKETFVQILQTVQQQRA